MSQVDDSDLMDTGFQYMAHAKTRFVSLESQAAVMEAQTRALRAQMATLSTHLIALRQALKHEISIATREAIVAAHESKHRPRKPNTVADNVF